MKFFGTVVLLAGLVFGVAYIGGAFDIEAEIRIDRNIEEAVTELTTKTIDDAERGTESAINKIKNKLKEIKEKD